MSENLLTINEDGTAPKSRVKDASSLRSIYKKTVDADVESSHNRALWRAMVDGEPPYDQAELDESGQSERSNLDFGYGRAAIAQTQSSYYDLISSVPVLITPYMKASYASAPEREEWSQIIAEGFTRMLRRWKRFHFNFLLLTHWFIEDGVGICYFEDETNWKFRVDSLQNVKIHRGAEADEESLDFVFIQRKMRVHELFKAIEDPEAAYENGWNEDAVKEVLLDVTEDSTNQGRKFEDWESLQEDLKNNDLACGYARAQEVDVIHALVKEFSGKVSHFMLAADSEIEDDYLMEFPERYDCMEEAVRFFTFGVGNGTFHSIRGKAYEVYPYAGILNELGNSAVDGAKFSATVMLQPVDNSTKALDDLALSYYGPFGILPPGFKAVERTLPNFANNVIPAMSLLQQQMMNNTGGYDARAVTPDGQARTATEIQAQLHREAALSSSAVDIFYMHWGAFLNEIFRRAKRKDYGADEPGGREIADFRIYCTQRGVPADALENVDYVDAMRAVGMGSAAQRQLAHDDAAQFAAALDERGRENLLRDRLADRFGYDLVDRYRPRSTAQLRPVMDEKIAIMESALMQKGTPIPVSPGENHFVHAKVHIGDLLQVIQALGDQQMDPPTAFGILQIEIPHTGQHIAALTGDVIRADEVAAMRQSFQQISAMATRLGDSLQAAAQQQAQAQAAEQQRQQEAQAARVRELENIAAAHSAASSDPSQLTPEMQATIEYTRARAQALLADTASKIRVREATTSADLAERQAQRDQIASASG